MDSTIKYSVIVPVYNRIDEVRDLLLSLEKQDYKNFEVIIVEDGSSLPCKEVADESATRGLNVKYFYKTNEGRSVARNYGIERASGNYFIFFDSDCVIPSDYFTILDNELRSEYLDCFGGPDSAHESFTDTQKAINYSMTSFLTTGGIRGGKIRLEKFTPRSFNMGFSREVYETVGGFREMFSEDIDISTRIRKSGFKIGLIRNAAVWHKRRMDLKKFIRQVYVFGMSRITLKIIYPDSLKAVHCLPALFVIACVLMIILALTVSAWFITPLIIYLSAIFLDALHSTKNLKISLMAVPASIIQLGGYGCGFIKAYFNKIILGKGRDIKEEIIIRKGK